jgi:pyridoxal phosphate enzyme (YggS family)
MTEISKRIHQIQHELPQGVTLLAVSKNHSPEFILQAFNAGLRDFGENYVQEMHAKHAQLPKSIHWHFIGHLQRNKVKQILPYVYLIHSVDREELACEIEKQASLIGKIQPVLLQLHVASETSKFGFSEDEFHTFINSDVSTRYPHINILGLMAMGSFTNETAILEQEFKRAKKAFLQLSAQFPQAQVLSMGMSSDYKLAIAQGSTMVRMGTAIFGDRKPTK